MKKSEMVGHVLEAFFALDRLERAMVQSMGGVAIDGVAWEALFGHAMGSLDLVLGRKTERAEAARKNPRVPARAEEGTAGT